MNYAGLSIALQEVPGEISICFSITGCNIKCKGCHSSYLWKPKNGKPLTPLIYKEILTKYKHLASCVLFMGGEWHENELIAFLKIAREFNYKTCLYSGETSISNQLLEQLTWVKTGPWVEALGGLEMKSTNQIYREVKTNKILNHLFQKN